MKCLFLLPGLGLTFFLCTAQAADFPVEVTIRCPFDKDREQIERHGDAKGSAEASVAKFEATLENGSFEPQKNIRIRVFVVAVPYDFTPSNDEGFVVKMIEKKDLEVGGTEKMTVPLGEAEFKTEAYGNSTTIYRAGIKYKGWVGEIYAGDQLIKILDKGGKLARNAYFDYLKSEKKAPKSRP